jgi:serine/threonine protein phosphatase PrpC
MEDAVVCAPKLDWFAEDAALFGVFDGHGGAEVSAFVASRIEGRLRDVIQREEAPGPALKQTLLDIEEEMRNLNTTGPRVVSFGRDGGRYDFVGCTAAVALLTRTALAVVNVGDSRIFKCRQGECVPLTRDHKPESPRERRRIEAAGGTVVQFGPCYRIDCNLNLSRALGDFKYKDSSLAPEDQKVSPVGDVTVVDLDAQDEFVVVACDGLFELMTWTSVCSYVRERIRRGMPLAQIAEGLLDECCSPNMLATCGRGTDNETVIIVQLSPS